MIAELFMHYNQNMNADSRNRRRKSIMQQQAEENVGTRIVRPKILYFGTPVVLLTTLNEDETTNITPMSSAWALGNRIILGLGEQGHGMQNLRRHGECVVNLPSPNLWRQVEALAPFTGANPIPEEKRGVFRYEKDKFKASGLTAVRSHQVMPDRISECPLQIEAKVVEIRSSEEGFGILEVQSVVVHSHEDIVVDDHHIDPTRWSPILYNFRHYFGLGEKLGKTFRAEV
jgi:flavin reductase (DIM6/NTAB) family NADH-FMN oxidoreductase RutF